MTEQQSAEAPAEPSVDIRTLVVPELLVPESGNHRRSRSPRRNVFNRLRSSSLGRSLSNLRNRQSATARDKERPVSGIARRSSTSSHEEVSRRPTAEGSASPGRWKIFHWSSGQSNNHRQPDDEAPPAASQRPSNHHAGMLRLVRRQLRHLAARGCRKSAHGNAAERPAACIKHEAVAEWLGQSVDNDLSKSDMNASADAPHSEEVAAAPRQAPIPKLETETTMDTEADEDSEGDEDMSSRSEVEMGRAMTGDEETSKGRWQDDADSTWTEVSRFSELMRRAMVKSKDSNFPKAVQVWEISIHLISGSQLVIRDSTGTSDPYVKFKYKGKLLEKSKIVRRSLNPIWDEYFCFYIDDNKKPIEVRVYDHDKLSDDYMGRCMIDLGSLEPDSNTELTLELEDETGKSKEKFMGTVRLACKVSSLLFDPETLSSSSTRGMSRSGTDRGIPSKAVLLIKGIKSALDTGRTRLKPNSWIATVTITLIEGRNLLAMDNNGLSDPFVKFRLGSEKYRSKVQKSTLNPRWLEQFDLRLTDECMDGGSCRFLIITVWDHDDIGRNDFMGRTSVDLAHMRREHTHLVEQSLEDGAGMLRLLITISGTYEPDSVTDLRNYTVSEVDRQRLVAKFSLLRTFNNMRDVGWLQVKVLKAEGLVSTTWSGKTDAFCVVELVNSRLQTHTEYKTNDPEWNKVFVFNVWDIHSELEVTVFDEDRDKKADFVGKVAIPLLRIRNGEKRWYALKERKLLRRVKGAILLEMDFIYNNIRAAWRTINPKEKRYALPSPKFKIAVMRRHIDRCKRIIDSIIMFGQFVESCWSWESPARSCLAFLSFMVAVWTFEPYMLPLTLVLVFSKEYTYNTLLSVVYRKSRPSTQVNEEIRRDDTTLTQTNTTMGTTMTGVPGHQYYEDQCVYPSSSDEDDDKSDKQRAQAQEDRRTLKEKIQSVQDIMMNVQVYMGSVASFFERIHNTFIWSVPWLSLFAVLVLIAGTIVLYLVPVRWLLLAWGVNKFTKKLIRPHSLDNNELFDFLSRVPSDMQLLQYKDSKPDLAYASDAKKR